MMLSIFYLFIGLLLSDKFVTFRLFISKILAKILIPFVIIYNIINYNPDYLILMLFSISSSCILFSLYYFFNKDSLKALCFSYSNIGWLGVPVASSLFGSQSTPIMISLYVGGSIFGNSLAELALSNKVKDIRNSILNVFKTPPFLAVLFGLLINLLGLDFFLYKKIIDNLYLVSKESMVFCGMCVLGMWLRKAKYTKNDFKEAFYTILVKSFIGLIFTYILYKIFIYLKINIDIYSVFLIFILPPAANIVALETAYRGTGRCVSYLGSSTIISFVFIAVYYLFIFYR